MWKCCCVRNKILCFRGSGREPLWSEQSCCSSHRLCSVSCLPPTAPGISTGCSLGPGIWVKTSNVLLLIQKPLISWEHSFLWWLPRPGLCPEIVVCGSVGGLGHGLNTVGELWPLGHWADGRQQDSSIPGDSRLSHPSGHVLGTWDGFHSSPELCLS